MRPQYEFLLKNGFKYNLVLRELGVAIYEQRYSENVNYNEVFSGKVKHSTISNGKDTAWSIKKLDDAMVRFRKLIKKIKVEEG